LCALTTNRRLENKALKKIFVAEITFFYQFIKKNRKKFGEQKNLCNFAAEINKRKQK